ncbi:MAG: hypothetical protein HY443_00020 [Candidatus Nealsonbacteria bacterium]|nr:hypothetical protein [Candidatus Nealsonbacteria bacterium]
MEISQIVKKIKQYLKTEDRKDVEFRALIALTELGDIVKYITHDQKLNPDARLHGTKKDEALAYGQALVQTIATAIQRGIDAEEAVKLGLENWADRDWRKKNGKKNQLSGILAFPGNVQGKAYIFSRKHPIEKMPVGSILVADYIAPALASHLAKAGGIVTNQGGMTSHAAVMAREQKIPCVVGTRNATVLIPHGQDIKIIRGKIWITQKS